MTRLTISLDDDLYAMARAHAFASKTSISKAVADLLRRKTAAASTTGLAREPDFHINPVTLLPVVRGSGRALTGEEIRDFIDDDDLRHLEAAGGGTLEAKP